jgi:hypothetical protein
MTSDQIYILGQINLVFTGIFTFECVLKVIGLGFRTFIKDSFNVFDAFIVMMSLVELALASEDSGGSSFGAMRAVRLFRVFKLFKSGDLRILMDSIAFTVTSIGNYGILLALFIYVYSLLGMN